jgi:hypothetical protein
MTKHILATLFFAFVSYAIVSDLGKSQHSYPGPSRSAVVNQNVP